MMVMVCLNLCGPVEFLFVDDSVEMFEEEDLKAKDVVLIRNVDDDDEISYMNGVIVKTEKKGRGKSATVVYHVAQFFYVAVCLAD